MNGRTLRLLANAYLEWNEEGHLQKALNAIALAESEHYHYSALYLRLKILLLTGESAEKIRSCFEDMLNHPDSSLELGLGSVDLLCSSNRKDVAVEGLKKLQSKYEHNPDVAKVCTKHLELLLQGKLEEEAKAFAEETITAHHSNRPLDASTRKRFHMIFWEHAADLFEGKCHLDAVQWYNFSLSLYTPDVICNKNLAKLHRNRVACYLVLGDLQKAEEASVQAEKADADSPYTQYILLRVAIAEGDVVKAKQSIKEMSGNMKTYEGEKVSPENQHGLICLAAQIAFEAKQQEVALVALEDLIELGGDPSMVLTALRCTIRFQLTDKDRTDSSRADMKKIISYLKTGSDHLQHAKDVENSDVDVQKESLWFMKIAWNMALQSKECPADMRELYKLCCKLTCLCGDDVDNLNRQKTCLMMVIACGLEQARQTQDTEGKKQTLQEVLLQLEDCKRISEKLRNVHVSESDVKTKDTTEILLLLYEFEAKAKLGDPDIESVLERALSMSYSEPKTYETMAALAMESPAQNREISKRALKAAIRKHLQTEPTDLNRLSRAFHSLVSMALQAGSLSDRCCSEEAFSYYKEVREILNKVKESYPEMEILWLMTKAWNQGIYLFSADQYEEAEKWCSMSLNFLTHLPSMKSNYEDQMNTVYSEILSKIENRNISSMEE
ncbi:testis-expressed protein 11-like isoform X2 [Liolophura sinensis]|uniref:testis-expressed protein 11-like isoform X2 n=1 Tax=Liolophura sinensis TaxID=3198878 RepID=UPI0031598822